MEKPRLMDVMGRVSISLQETERWKVSRSYIVVASIPRAII